MIGIDGRILKCPKCGSTNVIAVHPFDYIKQCENKRCSYRLKPKNKKKGWRYQWSGGGHN